MVVPTPAVVSVKPNGLPTPLPDTNDVPSSNANLSANSVAISDSRLNAESSNNDCDISTIADISCASIDIIPVV